MLDYTRKLLVKVSELYYNQNLNQQQIANKLKISRVKVSRLLTEARNKGIVKIEIICPKDTCVAIENKVESEFNLEEAVIVSSKGKSNDLLYNEVTKTAAQFLEEKVNENDTIGIAWGRTLREVVKNLPKTNKHTKIVQLLGNVGSSDVSGDVIVREIANSFNGEIYLLPTPAIVDSIEIKQAIMSDRAINNIFQIQKDCTIAVVGIGTVSERSTLVASGYLKDKDRELLKNEEAIGEVCGQFVNSQGELCNNLFNDRVLGISLDDLKNIPCVVAVAIGQEKSESLKAVLKTGVIDVVIADEKTAKIILK